MIIPCDDCGDVYDIPDDKWDDYNIFRKWNGKGSPAMCPPHLLCRKCTDKQLEKMNIKID